MALINFTLMGKGGVGKSYVSYVLAQHYQKAGRNVLCFDTDPVNPTFASFKALDVEAVRLGETAEEINPQKFDALLIRIVEAPEDAVVIVDNGAATFVPWLTYAVEHDVVSMIQEAGHEVRLHCVLTGGAALDDTLIGLNKVLTFFPDIPVVVWLNEYFGKVEKSNGKGGAIRFEDTAIYKQNMDRFHALVTLPQVRQETFGHTIRNILQARQTFAEGLADPKIDVVARQRLKMTWRTLNAAMTEAQL